MSGYPNKNENWTIAYNHNILKAKSNLIFQGYGMLWENLFASALLDYRAVSRGRVANPTKIGNLFGR